MLLSNNLLVYIYLVIRKTYICFKNFFFCIDLVVTSIISTINLTYMCTRLVLFSIQGMPRSASFGKHDMS